MLAASREPRGSPTSPEHEATRGSPTSPERSSHARVADLARALCRSPPDAQPQVDGSEVVAAAWYGPAAALQAASDGQLFLVFPTIKQLDQLSAFESADALLTHARGREVLPVQPRVLLSGETARVVLPGEPGYED